MPLFYTDSDFKQLNEEIHQLPHDLLIIIIDENTYTHCLPILLSALEVEVPIEIIEIPVGEEAKDIQIASGVWESFMDFKATRRTLVINCGGGVVTDFGGFVASLYKRGINFIHVPTSLLAMVDAAIGGKTGINFNGLKNQIGTFTTANSVHIHPDFLKTLPQREILSGFAEMIKHALIRDVQLWTNLTELEELTFDSLSPYIIKAGEIKLEFVAADFKEQGIRKYLNLGHTIGHALEAYFIGEFSISHGEAVACGIVLESHIAMQKNILAEECFNEICSKIFKFYPKLSLPRPSEIYHAMQQDKKNTDQKPKYVVLSKIGKIYDKLITADSLELTNAFDYYKAYKK